MADFEFLTAGPGLYVCAPITEAAIDRMDGCDNPVTIEGLRLANDAAGGLLSEGFSVSLDGAELTLGEVEA